MSDPKKCVAVVEEMGDVGFRISDAQVVADTVTTALRKRIGWDSVTYAGIAASASTMKKLLATPEAAGPQDAQLKWFKECSDNAPWRIRARFGTTGKKNWITLSCRKKGADIKDVIEEKRFEGKTFIEARDQLGAAMTGFCTTLPSIQDIPIEPAPGTKPGADAGPVGMSKKEVKPWTAPPRRD